MNYLILSYKSSVVVYDNFTKTVNLSEKLIVSAYRRLHVFCFILSARRQTCRATLAALFCPLRVFPLFPFWVE